MTAYDLSLGAPLPLWEEETFYLKYLRAVADWRTDWEDMGKSKSSATRKILEHFKNEKTPGAIALTNANSTYYANGGLPLDIAKGDEVVLARPILIVSQTVAERKHGKSLD